MKFCKILIFQQSGAEFFGSGNGLFILPLPYQFRIAAQKHFRYFPSVEFSRASVYRSGKKTVLKTVT